MTSLGTVYIGKRNIGKTAELMRVYNEAMLCNKKILVIDTATEHRDKSLIMKIFNSRDIHNVKIDSCSKELIVFPHNTVHSFPYELVESRTGQVYLCDASYYLEKGYKFPPGELREKERLFYKKFCMQVIEVLLDRIDIIIMDEVELIPESIDVLHAIYKKGVELNMALHSEMGLCGMDYLFRVERM